MKTTNGLFGKAGFPQTWVRLEVADTPALQRQGFKGRSSLPWGQGMLFVFPQDVTLPFTMDDVQFPLDILFLCTQGRVVSYFLNVRPNSGLYRPPGKYRFAIELPGGFYSKYPTSLVQFA